MEIVLFHIIIFIAPFLMVWALHCRNNKELLRDEFFYYLLLYFIVFNVGVQGVVTGVIQIFLAEQHCAYMDRPWSPFVWEVGMMNISFGLIGFLCLWLRGAFWAAAGLGYGLFLFLSFLGHMYEAIFHRNYSLGNLGPQVWIDLTSSFVLFYLIFRKGGGQGEHL